MHRADDTTDARRSATTATTAAAHTRYLRRRSDALTPLRTLVLLALSLWASLCSAMEQPPRSLATATTAPASGTEPLQPHDAAFATFFYDYGDDSDALFLATRVMMRSIKESQTKFRKVVLVPKDGIDAARARVLEQDDPTIEIVRTGVSNVFLLTSITDHRAQLLHMRNKLAIWDDPVLSQLQRVVYLDPENLVLRNMDEIFACTQFCAVDNGQSVVYSNSLLVISPASVAARNLYSDAIDSFMISGREYNYVGITQGFLPGLFEAFEESPLFYHEDDDNDEKSTANATRGLATPATTAAVTESVVHRLPFYYSINHMVFYERLNWDLYKCKDKNLTAGSIPGPLLSYKYSGATVKPWFWLPYTYFQVFWHWQAVRERLNEDHVGYFIGKLVSLAVIFAFAWSAYVALCLRLHSEPNGRPRRLSSWGLPAPGNAQPISIDVFNSKAMRKACQISCSILYAVSSTPVLSSVVLVLAILWGSIFSVPALMHPRYACKLWLVLHNLLTLTALLVFDIAHTFRTKQWKKGDVPSTTVLLLESLSHCIKRVPSIVVMQCAFLYVVGRTDWFVNPVLRPVVVFALLAGVGFVQMRVLANEMYRMARK